MTIGPLHTSVVKALVSHQFDNSVLIVGALLVLGALASGLARRRWGAARTLCGGSSH